MALNEILNSPLLYALVGGGILIVLCIAIFFYLRARKRALELGIHLHDFRAAMRGCIIFSIVPSIAVVIGLFSLAPLLGVPWPWFRLSVVGSVQYELMAADLAATSVGYASLSDFSTSGNPSAVGIIMFVMSISIMAGMVCNILFTKRICMTANSMTAKSGSWGALAISCFTLAMMCTFSAVQLTTGLIPVLVFAVSAGITVGLSRLAASRQIPWLNDYVMAAALILGMASAVFFTAVLK
jgi:hypothetical protein